MDSAYHNAVKRKKELEAELLEIQRFLDLYKRFSSGKSKNHAPTQAARVDATLPDSAAEGQPSPPVNLGRRRRGNPETIATLAEAILAANRRPMTRGELAAAIEEAGLVVPATDKAKYVGTILWRKPNRFENRDRKGYWLKDVPLSDAPTTLDWFLRPPGAPVKSESESN